MHRRFGFVALICTFAFLGSGVVGCKKRDEAAKAVKKDPEKDKPTRKPSDPKNAPND